MTYQLLNENCVPARNLKNTNIRNVVCFYVYFLYIIEYRHIQTVPPASCYPESPLIVWFKPYFHFIFKHTEYSARLLRRSNAYLFRKTEQHIHFTFHVYFDVIAYRAQATPSAICQPNV